MKKNLSALSSQLLALSLVLMLALISCSDDKGGGGNVPAPYIEPITQWGTTPNLVKSLITNFELNNDKNKNIADSWYRLYYDGNGNAIYHDYRFYRDRLAIVYISLDPEKVTKQQILNFLNANYKSDESEAKTRVAYENFNFFYISKDGKTGLNFYDSKDGNEVVYKIDYSSKEYFDSNVFVEPTVNWSADEHYITTYESKVFNSSLKFKHDDEINYDRKTIDSEPFTCQYFLEKRKFYLVRVKFDETDVNMLSKMMEIRYKPISNPGYNHHLETMGHDRYYLTDDGTTIINLYNVDGGDHVQYVVDYYPVK